MVRNANELTRAEALAKARRLLDLLELTPLEVHCTVRRLVECVQAIRIAKDVMMSAQAVCNAVARAKAKMRKHHLSFRFGNPPQQIRRFTIAPDF